ncbi:hypothetical protein BSL78_16523 [Apostichopus japonicus]|uniref:Uncharacterized protein n=1 Tax=Stichopus japonicus TaxID=307972 RepID=A0A2G8KF69_STIJA|nr:hypothetical protein BSL78_16523 [Apostichopus japonicus]
MMHIKKTQSAYRKQWAHKKKREMSSQQKRREREQNANQNTAVACTEVCREGWITAYRPFCPKFEECNILGSQNNEAE